MQDTQVVLMSYWFSFFNQYFSPGPHCVQGLIMSLFKLPILRNSSQCNSCCSHSPGLEVSFRCGKQAAYGAWSFALFFVLAGVPLTLFKRKGRRPAGRVPQFVKLFGCMVSVSVRSGAQNTVSHNFRLDPGEPIKLPKAGSK